MANGDSNPFDQFDTPAGAPSTPAPFVPGSRPVTTAAPIQDPTLPSPVDPTTGAVAPATTPSNPFDQFDEVPQAPPFGSQWLPILGRTFTEAMAPLGYQDLANELQREGQPVPTYPQYMASIPQEPRYGGPLGYLQQGAATLGGPISGPLSILAPGATIAGDLAHEAARQAGYSPEAQAGLSVLAGGAGGAAWDKGAAMISNQLASRAAQSAAAVAARESDAAMAGAGDVANTLAAKAGVADHVAGVTTLEHETGKVIQGDVENTDAVTGGSAAVKSTSRAMKTRAAKATGADIPPMTAGDRYLNDIDQQKDPTDALTTALGSPEHWKILPMKAKSAMSAYVARQVSTNPIPWMKMNQTMKNELFPDLNQRSAVEATANEALKRQLARPVPIQPAEQPSTWQNLLQRGAQAAIHHMLPRTGALGLAGHFIGPHLGVASPFAEAITSGLSMGWPAIKYAGTPRGITNYLMGGAQGYLGGPGNYTGDLPQAQTSTRPRYFAWPQDYSVPGQ